MNDSHHHASAPAPTGTNTYPPFPANPFFHETQWNIGEGQHQAKCVDYAVVEKHKRLKFGTSTVEEVDFVGFLFEIESGKHACKKIACSMLAINMHPMSKLNKLLTDWLGREPESDFQPQSFVGATATITVGVFSGTQNPDIKFPRIVSIAPGKVSHENAEGTTA